MQSPVVEGIWRSIPRAVVDAPTPEDRLLRESDLESAIIEKLQHFLLELGKGFAFVARQKRISLDDEQFYVDLVFYNCILKCYLLVDLKIGKLTHQERSCVCVSRRSAHAQVAGYLEKLGLTEGWLVMFDLRSTRPWDERLWNKDVAHAGKCIHVVGG